MLLVSINKIFLVSALSQFLIFPNFQKEGLIVGHTL